MSKAKLIAKKLAELEKKEKYLSESIIKPDQNISFEPTGDPFLDLFVGGGFPSHQTTYLWGQESTGKSTVALQAFGNAYKKHGEDALYVVFDTEESFDFRRAEKLGLPARELYEKGILRIYNLDTIESILKTIRNIYSLTKGEIPVFMLWDSVSSTSVEEEFEDEQARQAPHARILSRFFRNVKLKKWNMTLYVINQYRESNITNPFSAKEPPGGRAIRHKAYLTLFFATKKDKIISEGIGKIVTVYTHKSKIISPEKNFPFVLLFSSGFDPILTAIYHLIDTGIFSYDRKRISVPWDDKKYKITDLYSEMLKQKYEVFKPVFDLILDVYEDEEDKSILEERLENVIKPFYFNQDGTLKVDNWNINKNLSKLMKEDKKEKQNKEEEE